MMAGVTIRVGLLVEGFCGGHFGRDSYGPRRIEAIGTDWIVARNESGVPEFADCTPEELADIIDEQNRRDT